VTCSVVIPCHGGADLTRACIETLLAQDGGPPAEILLVDNQSPDDTATLGSVHPAVRVLRMERNLGFAGGVNAGIRAARGTHVLVLNNDTRAATNLLSELRTVLASDPRIGATAPVSNYVKGPARLPWVDARDAAVRAEIAALLETEPARTQDVDTLAGLCLLLRRDTFARIGLFDERFGHGNFEDDDFCLRLRLHGYRLVIARRAFLHHEGHATFRSMGLDMKTQLERRLAQFVAKWRADPAGRAVIAALSGDVEGAGTAAAEARRSWPLWPDADWHLARRALHRGEPERATVHLQSLLQQCPRHSAAAVELAAIRLARAPLPTAHRALAAAMTFHLSQQQQQRLLDCLAARGGRAAAKAPALSC
jgi:GT2 family glycosyltransferase